MSPLEQLKSVLCDPKGKCCIAGSDEDRAIIDRALQALAQPEQEPVAWMYPDDYERMTTSETFCTVYSVEVGSATRGESTVALYTAPPQRTWVGLTNEDRQKLTDTHFSGDEMLIAADAKLKEKNT